MAMSLVTDEFKPSFSSVRVIVTCSVSTMNADTPRALRVSLSVRANSSKVPPSEAFVIHCFAPVMRQPPSTRSAARDRAPASEPEPDSVSAKQPTRSPRASGGTKRARCSSVPNRSSGSVQADVCTATVTPTPASPRESSSSTRMYERKSAPAPPYSSGTHTPISPSRRERADQLARKAVVAVPRGGMRFDLGACEVAGERLDLALLRRELEVHGGHTNDVKVAAGMILAAVALAALRSPPRTLARVRRAKLERRPRPERQRGRSLVVRRRRTRRPGRRDRAARPCGGGAVERVAAVRRQDRLGRGTRQDRCARRLPPRRTACAQLRRPGRRGGRPLPRPRRTDRALAPDDRAAQRAQAATIV